MLRHTRIRIKKALAAAGLFSLEFALTCAIFFAAVFLFSFLAKEVFIDGAQGFDQRAFAWTDSIVSDRLNSIMVAITFLGTHKFLIPANLLLTGYFMLVRKHRWYSIKVASIALSSVALMALLKLLFARVRPLEPLLGPALGYSFPSGHSMMSFTFYGLLIYLVNRYTMNPILKWVTMVALGLLIIAIGFSRIYLRVHYATDVAAGFAMGIAWLMFSIYLLNRMEQYSKRKVHPVIEERKPIEEIVEN